ncbi:MAG: LD-carboxypeptidase [Salinivirgaceae bacterium]
MKTPPPLKKGDQIGIVAPAKFVPQDRYPEILEFISQQGFEPVRGKTTYLEHGPFAGTDQARLNDMQQMLDNTNLKALFCLRGGYGTIRIIDQLKFQQFTAHPKWLIGFSDITVLHAQLNNLGVESIHGQMPVHFNSGARGLRRLFSVLKGESLSYQIEGHTLNKPGKASGELMGGNLAILVSLLGTPYAPSLGGKILFIEEVGEYLYRFERMLYQLKLAGVLKNLKGLIVGGLSSMEDNIPSFGRNAEELVFDLLKDYDYPVCFGFPSGHIENNQPLIFGREVVLKVSASETELNFK